MADLMLTLNHKTKLLTMYSIISKEKIEAFKLSSQLFSICRSHRYKSYFIFL